MAVIAFLGFLLLSWEYRSRRERHLAFAALSLFAWSMVYSASFFGELVTVSKQIGVWVGYYYLVEYGGLAIALFLSLSLADLAANRKRIWAWYITAAVAPLLSFLFMLFGDSHEYVLLGGLDRSYDSVHFTIDHLGLFAAAAFMLLLGRHRWSRHLGGSISSGVRGYLQAAGSVLLVSMTLALAAVSLDLPWLSVVGTLLLLLVVHFYFLGIIGAGNRSPEIAANPMRFFGRRLVYKAAALNAWLFWILAYLLLLATSAFFVQSSTEQRVTGLRRDVHVFSRTYASHARLFLEETGRLAGLSEMTDILGPVPTALPASIREFIEVENTHGRILRVIGADGAVLFSTYSADEIGMRIASPLTRKALNGRGVAASEFDDVLHRWVLRAAVPFELPQGGYGGVLMATELSAAMDFSDYLDISPIVASGFGYVSEDGDTPYSSGESVDALLVETMRRSLSGKNVFNGQFGEGDLLFLERVHATDGSPNGFFYVFVRRAQLERETVRIIAVVMLLMHLALLALISILVFAIAYVLRPIKELRAAAARVEQGKYDFRISYAGADEVGDLAGAYNRMSDAIAERSDRLKQAIREQHDFIEHAVNDMRNPINAFRWTLEMMRFGDTGKLNRQQLEFLEQMNQTNERLARMVQNMRDVMRLDRGQFQLRPEYFSMEDLVDEVAGDHAVAIREKGVVLHWQRSKSDLPAARADRSAIRKVLSIFIGNAVKYTPANGHVEIQISRSSPGFLAVTVEDSGRGIPQDEQPRVFSRYFRSRTSIREEVEGSGLGLHVAKGIVELHGGRVWFESKENVGTTFGFAVPADIKG